MSASEDIQTVRGCIYTCPDPWLRNDGYEAVDRLAARIEKAERERDEARNHSVTWGRAEAADARADRYEKALRGLMDALAVDEDGNLTGPLERWADAWCEAVAALAGEDT